jgi:hypothetical protein
MVVNTCGGMSEHPLRLRAVIDFETRKSGTALSLPNSQANVGELQPERSMDSR